MKQMLINIPCSLQDWKKKEKIEIKAWEHVVEHKKKFPALERLSSWETLRMLLSQMVGNTCVEHTVWLPKVMCGFSVFWDVVIHILSDQIHVLRI